MASPQTIQAVIFDLGRVLVNIDLDRGLFRHLTDSTGESADTVVARLREHGLFLRYCRGELTPHAFHQALCAETGLALSYDEFVPLWCDIFLPMEGMEALLAEVADCVRVGILSDTDPLHWTYLCERYPMLQTVPRPTLSYAVGFAKPDPAIYRAAARDVETVPEACFFTDDIPANVEGARSAGMQALVFPGAAALRQHLAELGVL